MTGNLMANQRDGGDSKEILIYVGLKAKLKHGGLKIDNYLHLRKLLNKEFFGA